MCEWGKWGTHLAGSTLLHAKEGLLVDELLGVVHVAVEDNVVGRIAQPRHELACSGLGVGLGSGLGWGLGLGLGLGLRVRDRVRARVRANPRANPRRGASLPG